MLREVAFAPCPLQENPRECGLVARSDAAWTQVGCFNRVADALGTDLEPEMRERPEGWGVDSWSVQAPRRCDLWRLRGA